MTRTATRRISTMTTMIGAMTMILMGATTEAVAAGGGAFCGELNRDPCSGWETSLPTRNILFFNRP